MEIVSLFFICVSAGFFLYPAIGKVLFRSGGPYRDEGVALMKEALMGKITASTAVPRALKRKSFISREKTGLNRKG